MSKPKQRAGNSIICVDRDSSIESRLKYIFADKDIFVLRESSIDRVLERFEHQTFDVLIITSATAKSGKLDGIELLEVISAKSPATQIILLIDPREIRMAMSALKIGTYQYTKLPVSDEELRMLIETSLVKQPLFGANLLLKRSGKPIQFEQMVGQSQVMQAVYRQIRQAAATDIPVLLTGETGTGKDLAAQAIYQQSQRSDETYTPVHLGALPTDLVASELFGHEKGAFTGATEKHSGVFEYSKGGTVFLDEVSTIDKKTQISLLRLIEEKQIHRIGGRRSLSSDVRLIAATNENLRESVKKGMFREDLFFRLDVFSLDIPPLRDRREDIPLLIDSFLKRYNDEFQKNVLGISPDCVAILENYDWPGNVRELKNVIQRAVLISTGEVILPQHLSPRFQSAKIQSESISFRVGTPLSEIEREMIILCLEATGNNRKETAELLGISRRALYNKLKRYEIP